MPERKISPIYKVVKFFLRIFYGRVKVEGLEHVPEDACIIVANHAQLNGPICAELYLPMERYTWCQGQMLDRDEVTDYVFEDFWSFKPKRSQWFYKLMSLWVGPLLYFVNKNANTIGVYRDVRLLSTFKSTVKCLQEGMPVVIFPEQNVTHNHIVYDFQSHFIDVAKMYHKRTGKTVSFVPAYIAPRLRTVQFGKPVEFCPEADMDAQREDIRRYLMEEITRVAETMPEHTVVPYRNIPKKCYPKNRLGGTES